MSTSGDAKDWQRGSGAPLPGSASPSSAETVRTWLSPISEGAGLIPLRPAPALSATPTVQERARFNCLRDTKLRGYATATGGLYWSKANNLFPADPDRDIYQVRILRLSSEYNGRLNRYLDIGVGAGVAWFSGDAFDTFASVFATPISFEISPFAWDDTAKGRAISFRFALTWLGDFDEQDFCRGVTCAGIRDFSSSREMVPRISINIDPILFR